MPKTVRNVYDSCLSFEELLKAHKMARRGKMEKVEVIIFELNLESELLKLVDELKHGKYKKGMKKRLKLQQPYLTILNYLY